MTMTSSKSKTVVIVSLLLVCGLFAGVTATAAAQEQPDEAIDGDDQEDSEDEDEDEAETEGPHHTAFDLDENTRVTSVEYHEDNETMYVGLSNRGESRETIYLAEVVEPGAENWGFVTVHLRPGEQTTVTLEGIEENDGEPVVMVSSKASLENENVEWITTGEDPTTIVTLPQGVIIGILTIGVVAPAMAWRRYNKPGSAPEDGLKDDKGWF